MFVTVTKSSLHFDYFTAERIRRKRNPWGFDCRAQEKNLRISFEYRGGGNVLIPIPHEGARFESAN